MNHPLRYAAGRRAGAGFSLLEVLCAVIILSVGLVGVTEGLTGALRASKESERQTAAALLAMGKLEILRAESFVLPGETSGEFDGDMAAYTWTESIVSTSMDGLYEVTVKIGLASSKETLHELKSLIFDMPWTPTSTSTASGQSGGRL